MLSTARRLLAIVLLAACAGADLSATSWLTRSRGNAELEILPTVRTVGW